MILVIAVLVGVFAGLLVPYNLTSDQVIYVAVGIIAALDSVFGGFRSALEKNFNIYIFISGFFANSILAMLLTFIGNKLGVNFSIAAIVAFGVRIFGNAAEIRHTAVNRFLEKKGKKPQSRPQNDEK